MRKHLLCTTTALLATCSAHLYADVAEGERLVREGRFSEALHAMDNDGDTPESCYWRGRALAQLTRYAEATANFDKVPQDHPLFPYAAKGIMYCAWKSNFINFVEAVAPLTISGNMEIAALATAAMAEFQLRHTQGGDTSAYHELKRMAEEDPKLQPVLRLLEIENLRAKGKYDEAIAAARTIDENQTLPDAMRHRARLAMAEVYYSKEAAGQEDAAGLGEETLLQFISANPDSPLLEEAFRRLVLHRAFVTSSYAVDRLEDWSMEADKPHRAALALLMRQRAALAGNSPTTNLTALATDAAMRPTDPAAKTVIMEQVRLLLAQDKQQEAARFLSFIKDNKDVRFRFYEAACLPTGSKEALQAYLSCLEEAPADLQPACAANALYCAYQTGDEETVKDLLNRKLPRHARRAMLLMHAALTQESDPAAALQALESVEGLSPTPNQEAELILIRAAVHVMDDPTTTLRELQELEKSGKTASWSESQLLRLYQLQMESIDNAQELHLGSGESAVTLARHVLATTKSKHIKTEFTFNLAGRLEAGGKHMEALQLLEKFAENATEPKEKARALLLAAEAAGRLGSMELFLKSMDLFTQCSRIPSEYQDRAIAHRAKILMWINRGDEALQLLKELLTREAEMKVEDRALALTVLADTYSMQGTSASRDLALQTSKKLLEEPGLSPEWRARAILQNATFCSRYGMHDAALEDYLTILKTNPATRKTMNKAQWFRLVYASSGAIYEYLQLGKPADAADLAEKVVGWLKLCQPVIAEELDLEDKRQSFERWAKDIRRSL